MALLDGPTAKSSPRAQCSIRPTSHHPRRGDKRQNRGVEVYGFYLLEYCRSGEGADLRCWQQLPEKWSVTRQISCQRSRRPQKSRAGGAASTFTSVTTFAVLQP